MVSQLNTIYIYILASMHVSFQRTKLYNRFFTTKAPIHNNFEVLYVSSLFRKVVLMLMKPFVRVYSELGVGCGYWNPVTTSKLPGYQLLYRGDFG